MDLKKIAATHAASLIRNHQAIGLGGGSTVAYMVGIIKEKIDAGMDLTLCTSSSGTAALMASEGLPMGSIGAMTRLDCYFDGCDQFDKDLNALKSGGGIHTHEKLLASMASEFILVGDESKRVVSFDGRFPLTLECIPQAISFVESKTREKFKNIRINIRYPGNLKIPLRTPNQNLLLDIWFESWPPLIEINPYFKSLPGMVETSLFFEMAGMAIIGGSDGLQTIRRTNS